ncbi:MAG: secondary thiamine-phosphate synthase enzyme YjbQ [Candidatus Aminicenantes bacterium]|nr:secondary thiamine-phosphate synthase enzyme YjbQ [Candidatus Aminicenantes bacterium]MCK5004620.1 secondary thiamine-phosphate synthase enzyme YjbQ [Candidatus Aminicenantes bacterium]
MNGRRELTSRCFRQRFSENWKLNRSYLKTLEISTGASMELKDISGLVNNCVEEAGIQNGIVLVYTPHTTAGITINENADPSVKSDMIKFFSEMVPDKSYFRHMEGNSSSHIMSSLISPSQSFILDNGRLILGTWQGIFFCEFDGPRSRKVYVKILSEDQ